MSTDNSSGSKSKAWSIAAFGVVLMVGGAWFSKNVHLGFQETLEHQGIPLDLGKTISTIGVFLILFPVVRFFFLTPLQEAISRRTNELEGTFSEAEELRREMTQLRTDYEKRLQETEASAREQIQSQIKEAQKLRSDLMAEAGAKADDMIRRATEEIDAQREKLLTELRVEVVNLTLGATERLLGENMDTEKNRRLVREFVEKVEVPG